MRRALAGIGVAFACLLCSPPAVPCVAVSAPGTYVGLGAEKTLVVWDARAKVEHFVRRPVFEGDPRTFGFIVPTPAKPEVAKESDAIFDRLEAIVPVPVRAEAHAPRAAVAGAAAAPVAVEQRVQIDDFELVTLRAEDPGSLARWLAANGFADRPEIAIWAQKYVARGWVFNAMRYAPKEPAPGTKAETPTVRLSFAIEAPFYPYTEAPPAPAEEQAFRARTRSPAVRRPLDVWVVAEGPVEARAAGRLAGPTEVARAVVPAAALAGALGTTVAWRFEPGARATWTVTRFHEEVARRTAFDDLVFTPPGGSEDGDAGGRRPSLALLVVLLAAVATGIAVALKDSADDAR